MFLLCLGIGDGCLGGGVVEIEISSVQDIDVVIPGEGGTGESAWTCPVITSRLTLFST